MTQTTPSPRPYRRPAFTVIEMLVVIFIIAILAGIVISLAQRVTQGGKFAATKNALEVADSLLTEYISQGETAPPLFISTNRTQTITNGTENILAPETYLFPIIDGRLDGRVVNAGPGATSGRFDKDIDPAQPTGALVLLAMTSASSGVERQLKGVDAKFVQERDVYAYGWLVDANTGEPTGQPVLRRLRLPVLLDAFGNPIRYVHAGFQGGYGNYYNNDDPPVPTTREFLKVGVSRQNGQPIIANFSRSYRPFNPTNTPNFPVGDADEGQAVGGHGYFYSAGLDGDPGTREDNVYSKTPQFPTDTARMN